MLFGWYTQRLHTSLLSPNTLCLQVQLVCNTTTPAPSVTVHPLLLAWRGMPALALFSKNPSWHKWLLRALSWECAGTCWKCVQEKLERKRSIYVWLHVYARMRMCLRVYVCKCVGICAYVWCTVMKGGRCGATGGACTRFQTEGAMGKTVICACVQVFEQAHLTFLLLLTLLQNAPSTRKAHDTHTLTHVHVIDIHTRMHACTHIYTRTQCTQAST